MHILLTGGSGFLGRAFVSALKETDATFSFWKGDVRDFSIRSASEADIVVHLAARTIEAEFKNDPVESFDVNVNGTAAVFASCHNFGIPLIFASTAGVYKPSNDATALDELTKIGPTRLYPLSKAVAEKTCLRSSSAIPITILRFFNIYGPGQKLPFFIPDVLDALQSKRMLELRMPDAVRDFVHVDDAARAIVAALEFPGNCARILNVGSGHGTKILDALRLIEKNKETNLNLKIGKPNPGELDAVVANISRIKKEIGWLPRISLQSGISSL